jgi:Fe-Mn family superoxide dismutase
MDVFEHAFITDYGLRRNEYIEAFFGSIDWAIVNDRLAAALTMHGGKEVGQKTAT